MTTISNTTLYLSASLFFASSASCSRNLCCSSSTSCRSRLDGGAPCVLSSPSLVLCGVFLCMLHKQTLSLLLLVLELLLLLPANLALLQWIGQWGHVLFLLTHAMHCFLAMAFDFCRFLRCSISLACLAKISLASAWVSFSCTTSKRYSGCSSADGMSNWRVSPILMFHGKAVIILSLLTYTPFKLWKVRKNTKNLVAEILAISLCEHYCVSNVLC